MKALLVILLGMAVVEADGAVGQVAPVIWRFEATNAVRSSPAIGPEGTIYFGAGTTRLLAVSHDGTLRWIFETNTFGANLGVLAPVVADDGTVYAAFDRHLFAITSDGIVKWKLPATNSAEYFQGRPPALFEDGSLAVTPSGAVERVLPNGSVLWRRSTLNSQAGFPVISPAQNVYSGSYHGNVYSYNADGTSLWAMFNPSLFQYDAAMAADGTQYGAAGSTLLCVRPNGTTGWVFNAASAPFGSPALDASGTIYFAADAANRFYALHPNGTLKWERPLGGRVNCSPAVDDEGRIYVCTTPGNFYVFEPDGRTNRMFEIGGPVISSPVLADDGTIYIGSGSTLVALSGGRPPAASAWPMYRRDARHTARLRGPVPAPPRMEITRTSGTNALKLTLHGEASRTYTILSSSNLTEWATATNVVLASEEQSIPAVRSGAARFFQAAPH